MSSKIKPYASIRKIIVDSKINVAVGKSFIGLINEIPKVMENVVANYKFEIPEIGFGDMKESFSKIMEKANEEKQRQNELIKKRSEAIKQKIELREKRLVDYAVQKRAVAAPRQGKFIVTGQVTDKLSGKGLPNVTIKAVAKDRKLEDFLGKTRTDPFGYYRFEYDKDNIEKYADKLSETHIEILDDEQNVIFASRKSFILKAGETDLINAKVDGSKIPAKLALSHSIANFVGNRLNMLDKRRQWLSARNTISIGRLSLDMTQPLPPIGKKEKAPEKKVEKSTSTKKNKK